MIDEATGNLARPMSGNAHGYDGHRAYASFAALMPYSDGLRDVSTPLPLQKHSPSADTALKSTLNALPQMIWMATAAGAFDFFNDEWLAFTGVAQLLAREAGWPVWLHADDRALALKEWHESLASGAPLAVQCRLRRHDGTYRWMKLHAVPRMEAGTGAGGACWIGIFTDIHELKSAEQTESLVASELAHRLRNVFAMFSGLLTLSARSEPEARAFARDTQARLTALAHTQDYLLALGNAEAKPPASLLGLLKALLAPYQSAVAPESMTRDIEIFGPDVPVGTAAAKLLAMVVHELAINAIKHGAFAGGAGALRLETRIDGEAVCLVWSETGGPVIAGAPVHRGFGTTMAESALRTTLGGTLERRWLPSGLVVEICLQQRRLAV